MMREFIAESNRIEGIDGVSLIDLMAHTQFQPTIEGLIKFVALVAPGHIMRELPTQNVRIGNHIAPRGGSFIRPELEEILLEPDPHVQHCRYLTLHPFTDGNGRSARALWLSRMGDPPKIGFLHTFYYQTLSHADGR